MNSDRTELLSAELEKFQKQYKIFGKGPLSVMLVLTRQAGSMTPPLHEKDFITARKGQVKGLGGPAVQNILKSYGIDRILAEEGGRTSRGSIDRMRCYLDFLNNCHDRNILDCHKIEEWWVNRVKEFFSAKPLKLRRDASKSLRAMIADLMDVAFERQKECPGTMVAGAVMQHLVGAKLTLALPDINIYHEGFSVADAPTHRKGDFLVHDTAIHVTTAPGESLIRKCKTNLEDNLRPVIITTESGTGGAKALATNHDIADRVDILEIEQFIATNIFEWSGFLQQQYSLTIKDLIEAYNIIIENCETDPSLKIIFG
jgi:hypothetical protein